MTSDLSKIITILIEYYYNILRMMLKFINVVCGYRHTVLFSKCFALFKQILYNILFGLPFPQNLGFKEKL